jgi:FG-GAP repeat
VKDPEKSARRAAAAGPTRKGLSSLAQALLVAGVVACSSLPEIPRGTCGNHVLENNEDCDGAAPQGAVCRAAGQADACRFDCSSGATCPAGYGCGADSVCRLASGNFAPLTASIPSSASSVGLADYDGDGLTDIREVGSADIRVRFGDTGGDLGQSFLISVSNAHPVAGQLTGDKRLDLSFASADAVAVWRGDVDRTLTPTTYPTISIPTAEPIAFVTAEVLRQRAGSEVLVFAADVVGGTINVRTGDELNNAGITLLLRTPQPPRNLAFPLLAAQFDEDPVGSPCQELVYAFTGAHEVNVFTPCRGDVANGPVGQRTLPPVAIPSDTSVSNVFVLDWNKDGHLDMVILGDEGRAFLAFGAGNGLFSPTFENPDIPALIGTPLTLGFITDDDLPDFVTTSGIVLFVRNGAPKQGDAGGVDAGVAGKFLPAPTGINWTEAHIGDFNGNGMPDVICASPRRIDFYNGTGTVLLDPSFYRIDGTPGLFDFGDFDGDLALDITFREDFDNGPDGLSVMFGNAGGFPAPPVSEGRLGTISIVSAGALSADDPSLVSDGISDIGIAGVSADKQTQFVSILTGSSDRLLQSPFVLSRQKSQQERAIVSGAVGFATGQFTSDTKLGDPHVDLAVVGVEASGADSSAKQQKRDVHMWLIPVSGEAQIDPANVTVSDTVDTIVQDQGARRQTKGLDWTGLQASLVALDLDAAPAGGPALEELVALVPPTAELHEPGAILVFKVTNGVLSQVSRDGIGAPDAGFLAPWTLRRTDVDGDGAPDVLAVYRDAAGMAARVYINKKNGALDRSPIALPSPPKGQLLAATALNTDGDVQREIALLTDAGVFIADLAADGQSFSVASVPALSVSGNSIAAGDVNGDGVEDLAISGNGLLQVFKGIPVLP